MKIAIVKLSALGDIVHAMAALQFIKKYNPKIEIDWIVEESFKELISANHHINQVHTVNIKNIKKSKSIRLLIIEIKKIINFGTYDLVIDAQGLLKSSIVSRFIRSNYRFGFDRKSIREPIACAFYNRKVYVDYEKNTIDRMIELLCSPFDIKVSKKELIEKEKFLYSKNNFPILKQPYLLFVIGSTWESRNYPKEKFLELAEKLQKKCFVIWGTDEEKNVSDWLCNKSKYINPLSKMSLSDLIVIIEHAQLVIGNDTGPTHMAWGLNTPSITLFGPTPISRVFQTPFHKVLKSNSKVDQFNLNKDDFSINEIKVNDIVKMALEILE